MTSRGTLSAAFRGALTLLVFSAGACTRLPAVHPRSPRVQQCSIAEVSREQLTVNGRTKVYVEADAFVADVRGDVLLAGMPNMLIHLNEAGRVTGFADDSVLGAIIPRSGPARTVGVPVPFQGQLDGVRAIPRPEGGWMVTFAEVKERPGRTRRDSASHLWFGIFDGDRWQAVEELPLPPRGRIDPHWASSLVRRGDTLSWAMTMRDSAGLSIILFERRAGTWSHELVRTFHSEVELAVSEGQGLSLLVVQPDPTALPDGNSLLVWRRDPQWRRRDRLVYGSTEGAVQSPRFTTSGGSGIVTWLSMSTAGTQLRASIGWPDEADSPAITLDSLVTGVGNQTAPAKLGGGVLVWVSDHVSGQADRPALRFVREHSGAADILGEIPSPYLGFTAAVGRGSDEVLVTGLQQVQVPSRYIASLLLRARVQCRAAPGPARERNTIRRPSGHSIQ